MSEAFFERYHGESVRNWVLRLHLDPWFEDMTPAEIADFTGTTEGFVLSVLTAWASSSKVRRIHVHAKAAAEQIGWPGTPEGLIHIAIERYVQRFGERANYEPTMSLDDEVELFLATLTPPARTGT